MGKSTRKETNISRSRGARKRATRKRRAVLEQERAQEVGFLALAKEVAQENAEALRLLAKH